MMRPSILRSVVGVCVAGCLTVIFGGRVPAAGQGQAAAPTPPAPKPAPTHPSAKPSDWIQLFNGKDLNDWLIKFSKHDLGDNFNDTFRVENGLLEVRYDKWTTTFNGEFGHIFYKEPFSYYRLAAEYRFVGEQVKGGPGWAMRNNGLMIMSPHPRTMTKDQDFPISLEVQLLGGLSDGKPRPTANLCSPGTNVVMDGKLFTTHCKNSVSKTYDGDQWVRVEVEVHGDELVQHIAENQVVLEYTKPQMGGGNAAPVDPAVFIEGKPLTSGYISLQAETAPADFRKVELLNLEGCMDKSSPSYRDYFIKSNPAACKR
jgi:hypothetical protein